MTKIVIVGLGYVGLPLAVLLAEHYDVTGIDIDERKIKELEASYDRMGEVSEKMLEESKLKYSNDLSKIGDGNIVIVTVPTPVDKHNNPDLTPIRKASESVGKHIKKGTIVVYESTVYPGTTEEICGAIIEEHSGLKHGTDFFLGYSPERVNPGDKNRTIDKIIKIVSGSTPEVRKKLEDMYGKIITAGIHSAPSIRVAEAAKVIENVQRDLNIALMNELNIIFDKLGIDVHSVLEAAQTKWNFHKYTPGLVGGHCIGVDPYYLTHKAKEVGYNPEIILAGRRLNDNMHSHYAQKLIKELNKNGIAMKDAKIAVLGLTFKEDCSDYRNTRSKHIVRELADYGADVIGVDPWLENEIIEELGARPVGLSRLDDEKVDAVIITVPHKEFFSTDFSKVPVLIDIKGRISK